MNQKHRHRFSTGRSGDTSNLLPNPGFEEPSPTDPMRPDGWAVDTQASCTLIRSPRSPRSGQWALDATLQGPDSSGGTVQLVTQNLVEVTPGAKLVIGGSFLLQPNQLGMPTRASVWVAGRWIDTSRGRHIVGSFLEFPAVGIPAGSYQTRSSTIRVPESADALIAVFILAGGDADRAAELTIDDLFLHSADDNRGDTTERRDASLHHRHTTTDPSQPNAAHRDPKAVAKGLDATSGSAENQGLASRPTS